MTFSSIFNNITGESLEQLWNSTEAAGDYSPLPAGKYLCVAAGGELGKARTGTPYYRVLFEVAEGPHAGRRVAHDVYLSPKAIALAKRDLSRLGINSVAGLERPLPRALLCEVRIALRKDDDGTEFNRVRGFEVRGPAPLPAAPAQPDPGTGKPQGGGLAWDSTIGADSPPAPTEAEPAPTTPPPAVQQAAFTDPAFAPKREGVRYD